MDSIKISATFEINGSQMYSQAECDADVTKTKHEVIHVKTVVNPKAKNKKYEHTAIHTNIRKSIPATQSINMTDEAYEYFISNEAPSFSNPKAWKKLSNTEKIEAHLNEVAKSLRGKLINYKVFED